MGSRTYVPTPNEHMFVGLRTYVHENPSSVILNLHDYLCSVADKNQWFVVRMINSKCPYVGHGLRVRRRRTESSLTTYFSLTSQTNFSS